MTTPDVRVDAESLARGAKQLGSWAGYWAMVLSCAVAAYVMALLASESERKHRWIFGVVGALATVLVLVLPARRTYRSERSAAKRISTAEAARDLALDRADDAEAAAIEAKDLAIDLQARFNSSIGDVISPIATELAGLSCASGVHANEIRAAVLQQIVDAAVTLCGSDGVRSVVYVLGATSNGKRSDLIRKNWTGRQDPPRQRIARKRGDARERAIHDLVDDGTYDMQDDVLAVSDTLYRNKRYRSLVAVAITAGGQPRGMLAVDAPEVSRFDRTHLGILLALAGLAAIALNAQVERVDADVLSEPPFEG